LFSPRALLQFLFLVTDGNLLDGTIPSEICLLEKLETINLERNGLHGTLPSCLSSLTNLIQINVKTNDLTGVLPPNLLRAPSLEILNLSENNFSGDLSILFNNYEGGTYPAFGTLSQLNLDHNDFSGEIPSQLLFLQALEELTLEVNSLSGTVDSICNARDIALFTVDCNVECECCNSCF
jgi:hypothetical protein